MAKGNFSDALDISFQGRMAENPANETKPVSKPKAEKKAKEESSKDTAKTIAKETPAKKAEEKKQVKEPKTEKVTAPVNDEPAQEKQKQEYMRISISLPEELSRYMGVASFMKSKSNVSKYIASLIEKDIAENRELYDRLLEVKM